MSRSQLRFEITSRSINNTMVYEAVAIIPGFGPAPVEKIEGGNQFSTKSAVTYACNNRAASLGLTPVISYTEGTTETTTTKTTASRKTVARTATPKTAKNSSTTR